MKFSPAQRDLQLQIIFAFLVAWAVLLFVSRPEPSTFQLLFRAAVGATGVAGLLYVSRRKQRRR